MREGESHSEGMRGLIFRCNLRLAQRMMRFDDEHKTWPDRPAVGAIALGSYLLVARYAATMQWGMMSRMDEWVTMDDEALAYYQAIFRPMGTRSFA